MVNSVTSGEPRERARLRHAAELPERKRVGGRRRKRSSDGLRTRRIRKGMEIAIRIGYVFEGVIIATRSMAASSE